MEGYNLRITTYTCPCCHKHEFIWSLATQSCSHNHQLEKTLSGCQKIRLSQVNLNIVLHAVLLMFHKMGQKQ